MRTAAWRGLVLPLVSLALAPAARADAPPIESGASVTLKVGQTKAYSVGLAMGLVCDDGTIVRAELRGVSDKENQLVLTGLKPGQTSCRAGTATMSISRVVNITVVPKNNHGASSKN